MSRTSPAGFTLLEALIVTVLIGLLAGLAVPSLHAGVQRIRLRSALDGLTGDLYLARALAARTGGRVQLRFELDEEGCVTRYVVRATARPGPEKTVQVGAEEPGLCISISGAPILTIDSRGMPVGAARKVRGRLGAAADSLTISMIGRIYRFSF